MSDGRQGSRSLRTRSGWRRHRSRPRVAHIDQLFAIEREIDGQSAEARIAKRMASSAPILVELQTWLRAQRERTSRKSEIGKAIDYALKR